MQSQLQMMKLLGWDPLCEKCCFDFVTLIHLDSTTRVSSFVHGKTPKTHNFMTSPNGIRHVIFITPAVRFFGPSLGQVWDLQNFDSLGVLEGHTLAVRDLTADRWLVEWGNMWWKSEVSEEWEIHESMKSFNIPSSWNDEDGWIQDAGCDFLLFYFYIGQCGQPTKIHHEEKNNARTSRRWFASPARMTPRCASGTGDVATVSWVLFPKAESHGIFQWFSIN